MGTAELHQGSNESQTPSPRPSSVSKEEESGINEEITKDIDIVSSYRRWEEWQRRLQEKLDRLWEELLRRSWEEERRRLQEELERLQEELGRRFEVWRGRSSEEERRRRFEVWRGHSSEEERRRRFEVWRGHSSEEWPRRRWEEERRRLQEELGQYRYRKMVEKLGGGYGILLQSIDDENDFIKLLGNLKMNRVEAKLVKVYIDGRLHSLENDGITLLIVCGIQIMMDCKMKETLRKNRKLTSKEDADGNAEKEESFTEETSNTSMNKEDLENSKKSVEFEKEDNVMGTFSASMKKEDHEKSMKSAEVENEDNFKEKGSSTTSMNKEDHGNILKSVEVGKEDYVKGTFNTSMKEKDCENNMSVEVVKEDTFDEKGLSSTSMNIEDHDKSMMSTEVENEDNSKEKGPSSTRMNKEGEEKLEYRRCIICLSADLCMVFFPCRHVVACEACSDRLKTCAVCRALIRGSIKVN